MLLYLQRQVRTQMPRQSRKKSSTGKIKSAHRNRPHEFLVGLLGELQDHWVSVGLELASLIQFMENKNS